MKENRASLVMDLDFQGYLKKKQNMNLKTCK